MPLVLVVISSPLVRYLHGVGPERTDGAGRRLLLAHVRRLMLHHLAPQRQHGWRQQVVVADQLVHHAREAAQGPACGEGGMEGKSQG